ncbi:MAG TPA: hypothetical protein VK420_02260 [Longimicrobium sp.]|nr:hypothetical protein [Longimicrobium sp.]
MTVRAMVIAALARGVLAWLAMVALGAVSALAVPGALWIAAAAAWTASDIVHGGWMERSV